MNRNILSIATPLTMESALRCIYKLSTLAALLATLAACGESDLEALHKDAVVAAQEANLAAGQGNSGVNTDNDSSGSNNDNDSGDNSSSSNDNSNNNDGNDSTGGGTEPLPQTPDTAPPNTEVPERNKIDLTGYQLVFNENFDGASIDSNKWTTAYRWGDDLVVNNEEQHYIDLHNEPDFGYNPFRFDGEVMAIGANKTPSYLSEGANKQPYISGVITTATTFNFTHGYAEMRAQLPSGAGLWPQFWMLPDKFEGLKPQVFIAEMRGSDPAAIYHSYKWQNDKDELLTSDLFKTDGSDFSTGYHTYGLEWAAGELKFYVDGYEYHRFTSDKVASQDMYLILNLAVGGWFAGAPDDNTVFPAEMVIDHVRVYQQIE